MSPIIRREEEIWDSTYIETNFTQPEEFFNGRNITIMAILCNTTLLNTLNSSELEEFMGDEDYPLN